MTNAPAWPWLAVLLLGAGHGINPGMGWLFAVALGLQERKRGAVWRALPPLALGHALAIGTVLVVAALIGLVVPLSWLKWIVAATLTGFGVLRLVRSRHPRYGGMRVGPKDLTVWSFLMASAHGAGLMVLPFVLQVTTPGAARNAAPAHTAHDTHGGHAKQMLETAQLPATAGTDEGHATHLAALGGMGEDQRTGLLAALVHTLGYLLVMGIIAVIVYEKLGLRLLGRMWFNVDRVWGASLVLTGIVTPLL